MFIFKISALHSSHLPLRRSSLSCKTIKYLNNKLKYKIKLIYMYIAQHKTGQNKITQKSQLLQLFKKWKDTKTNILNFSIFFFYIATQKQINTKRHWFSLMELALFFIHILSNFLTLWYLQQEQLGLVGKTWQQSRNDMVLWRKHFAF